MDSCDRDGGLAPVVRMVLADSSDELRRVRQRVRSLLVGQDADRVTDALLIADELVTNSLEFGAVPREARLALTGTGTQLTIEVDSSDTAATVAHWPQADKIGRFVLEQLTADWGVHPSDGYKTTWAVIDLRP